ncbi:MAG TPA: NFACT family protein, partial [Candidatus Methanofastidiosa archaeon]|nr:NFACT family protein [Candidatus Methanofastidiosa archaeon]
MFSSFDVRIIVQELLDEYDILGMKVDKVYKIGEEIRIKLYGNGRRDLILKPGKAIFVTAYPKRAPQKPSGFAMQLRKYLAGLRIMNIEQIGFDRLVRISFGLYGGDDKEDIIKYHLILELFGNGNLILTDHEDKIIGILQAQSWSTRSLKAKETYEPPPRMMSPYEVDIGQLVDSNYEVVKLLATKMNIGGMYAEEICLRGGLDKRDNNPDLEKMSKGIEALINLPKRPAIVKGRIVPFDLMTYAGEERTEFKTLNEAADEVYGKKEMEDIATEQVSKKDKQMNKLERILSSQLESLDSYGQKAERSQMMGDLIFENYLTVDKILNTLHKAVKT